MLYRLVFCWKKEAQEQQQLDTEKIKGFQTKKGQRTKS